MLLYIAVAFISQALLCQGQAWNNLRVTWSINPFNPYRFAAVPRTASQARADGWRSMTTCSGGNYFRGERFILYDAELGDEDKAVMPLYDVNGFIAGIQTGIRADLPDYPDSAIIPPMHYDAGLNMYTMTAYFVDPNIICNGGRSQSDFDRQGTGDRLVLRSGSQHTRMPDRESGIAGTMWTEGKCFVTMGHHYWYNVRRDMSCREFMPMFLLYNEGVLNSFGWAFMGWLPGPRYEHPTGSAAGGFLPDSAPDCLLEKEELSTIHIYLTDAPDDNYC